MSVACDFVFEWLAGGDVLRDRGEEPGAQRVELFREPAFGEAITFQRARDHSLVHARLAVGKPDFRLGQGGNQQSSKDFERRKAGAQLAVQTPPIRIYGGRVEPRIR